MKKENYFKEVKEASTVSTLSNKVEIDTDLSYSVLHEKCLTILDDIDEGVFNSINIMEGKTESIYKHANNMIKLELLINQMNVIQLFEAVKNTPNDIKLKQLLEDATRQFMKCHAKESTYFA